jgi:hypothetical protein
MDKKNERAGRGPEPALDDSWFDRMEIRAVAAELRARLARAYRAQAGDDETPAIAIATPGLDDSWFR